mgnify:FL=1
MRFLIFIITVISGLLSTAWSGTIVDTKSGKFNSLIVRYRVDNESTNTKVQCSVKSESGDLIGLGIAKREDKLTSIMVGIPEKSLNSLMDVACEEK